MSIKSLILTVLFISLYSCTAKVNNQSTADYYSPSKDFYNNIYDGHRFFSQQNENILVLINNKKKNLSDFHSEINKNKVKGFNVIRDSAEIIRLGYSYKNIKSIIIVTTK
ncbi:hypothetical protein KRE40_10355 [Elizabethkingia meningoseptica]|uniref:hypothetical protein n=1 Tax=Elizabethkingia meningoseptica TaxID=238 RepID=UPI00084218F9|nr:hypothetical protein [Elizabethkingia meningoseptica]MDE5436923.1 hypothetical protein [Elizabethkingia meningoseptica]MDE5509050.1 hypothetical protein [Elizabethkingia meningoseptica]MDE5514567.1 hypothetical protein [Elizabethkingia meningoseptica]MDE5525214.1 hypothetical protein [Elizabethkingia meningoseptica]MDE5528778.1 hypothetical protein [Elizabethkingia meningoseptica]